MSVRRVVRELILPLMVAFGLAFVIQSAVAKPYEIPTPSMDPTIKPHDRIIANRLIYRFRGIRRGDIVVFTPTEAALNACPQPASAQDVPFVKRVIGLPGDRVVVRPGRNTLVNGRPFNVPGARPNDYTKVFAPVPADHILVLGDNRGGSCDSHLWEGIRPDPASDPFVPQGNVIGQAEVVYWPPVRVRFLD